MLTVSNDQVERNEQPRRKKGRTAPRQRTRVAARKQGIWLWKRLICILSSKCTQAYSARPGVRTGQGCPDYSTLT